jgi:hypothetical protein
MKLGRREQLRPRAMFDTFDVLVPDLNMPAGFEQIVFSYFEMIGKYSSGNIGDVA